MLIVAFEPLRRGGTLIPIVLLLGAVSQGRQFKQSAVWTPPANFRQQVLANCSDARARFSECFAGEMRASGASPEALMFSGLIHNDGYIEAFRPVGLVGVAGVNYPFRANENSGLFLVNGDPPAIDVDDLRALPQDRMKLDPAYLALGQGSHPTLWPGDRASVDGLLALELPDGAQQFIADYRVQDGCHACAVLGQAFFGFAFDKTGKFNGVKFTGFTTSFTSVRQISQKILVVPSGQNFTLVLPSNRTTGYSWKLARLADSKVLSSVDQAYSQTAGPQTPGRGGEERWTFHAASAGRGTLTFEYIRAWEKLSPAKKIVLTVNVQ